MWASGNVSKWDFGGEAGEKPAEMGDRMQNTLFQAICRMGIFMICAQAMIHFRPKEAYEKYLKLLVSVMVLIQIFLPIGNFLLGKGRQAAAQALEQFRQDLEQSMAQAEEDAAAADALLEKMTLEEVRSRLEAQKESGAQGNAGEVSPEEGSDGPEEPDRGEEEAGENVAEPGRVEGGVGTVEPIVIEVTIPEEESADDTHE